MEVKTISYSKSYEMITPFGLKYWEKISLEASLTDSYDETQLCLKALKDQVERFHNDNNQEVDTPYKEPVMQVDRGPVKLDPDASVVSQYKEAVEQENQAKITLIESIYNIEKLKDAIKE